MFVTHGLLQDDRITHGFFGRQGGVSTGLFESLNCGLGSEDNRAAVEENRSRVREALGAGHLLTARQEHTALCVTVNEPWTDRPVADAAVTDKVGIAVGILTADCAPVLFLGLKDNGAPVVGAAHAGWRGAVGGVLENTIAAMQALGAMRIKAVVGPCIGHKSYEVSAGFEAPFLAQDKENSAFFSEGRFDLERYVLSRLARAGGMAESCDLDTYALEADYFSYRRSQHRAEPHYGRQISAIVINQ